MTVSGQMPAASAAQEWRRNWGLAFASFLGMSVIAIPAVTLGIFMEPLEAAFGWTRAQISLGMTVFALITTPLAPFAGALADRFGSRRLVLPGLVLNGLAFAAFSLMTGWFALYIACWVVYSFSQLLIRTTVWNRALSASFHVSRGLALAVVMLGLSFTQTAAPVLTQALVGHFDWRVAFIAIGLGWAGTAFLASLLLFREPARETHPDSAGSPSRMAAEFGLTFSEALRDVRVWRIILAMTLFSLIMSGLSMHLFPFLTDGGIARSSAAQIIALIGISALAGQIVTGFLADRTSSALLPFTCYVMLAIAFVVLLRGDGSQGMLTLGVVIAGLSSSACVTIGTYLVTRYAGVRHFGKIYGIASSGMGLGAGIGPIMAGYIRDASGSYTDFLLAGLALSAVAALLVTRLGPYPRFETSAH
jgi:predicted MFS family arabinose efflux permease